MSRPAHPMQLSRLGPGAGAALCRPEAAIELDRQLGVLVKLRASRVHGCGFHIGLHWQEARAGSAGRRRCPCHDPHLGQGACQGAGGCGRARRAAATRPRFAKGS